MAIQPTRIASVDFAGGVNNLLRQFRAQEQQRLQEDSLRATTEHRNRMFDRLVANDERAQANADRSFEFQQGRAAASDARDARNFDFQRDQAAKSNARADARLGLERDRFSFSKRARLLEIEAKRNAAKGVNVGDEQKLRKEFQGLTKDFRQVRDSFTRVESSAKDPSAAGDLALIFNYMKILDPGSVVRESEFATAENAAGVPDRVRNIYNKVLTGRRLGNEQRGDFVRRAGQLFQGRQKQYTKTANEFRSLAERSNLNPGNVVLDLDRVQPTAEPKPRLRFNPQTGDFE